MTRPPGVHVRRASLLVSPGGVPSRPPPDGCFPPPAQARSLGPVPRPLTQATRPVGACASFGRLTVGIVFRWSVSGALDIPGTCSVSV